MRTRWSSTGGAAISWGSDAGRGGDSISFLGDTGEQVEKEEVAVLELVHQSFMLE